MQLPDNSIKHRWVKVSDVPKNKKVGKYSLIVDECYYPSFNGGGIHSIHIAYVRDHPFLKTLNEMENVPRATKSLYKASVRLKHLNLKEFWPILQDWSIATDKWFNYLKDRKLK